MTAGLVFSGVPTGNRERQTKIDPGQLALVGVCAGLEKARCSKGQMPSVADDNMVKNFDAEDAARVHKPLRHAKVGVGGSRVAARVIVHEHDTMRRADDCRPKNFARVSHRLGQRTNRDDVMPADAVLHIQHEDGEAFAIRVEVRCGGDVGVPVSLGGFRRLAMQHRLGREHFPHGHDAPFARHPALAHTGPMPGEEFKLGHGWASFSAWSFALLNILRSQGGQRTRSSM